MNILFFTAGLGLWWTERAAQDISIYLQSKYNWQCHFLSFTDGVRRKELEDNWITVDICNHDNYNLLLSQLLKKYTINVLYLFMVWWDSIDMSIIPSHVVKLNEVIFTWGYSPIPDINIVISDALKTKIESIYPQAKTYKVYFPINTEKRSTSFLKTKQELKKLYWIPHDMFLLWRIARPELTKRWWLFISTLWYLFAHQKNIWVVVVWLPLLYKVLLFPWRQRLWYFPTTHNDEELSQIYSMIDCYFHTAEVWETFWMVLAEAMLFGLPVITHSTHFQKDKKTFMWIDNSQIELIENNVNWFISNDPKQIHHRLENLISNERLYNIISENNKSKVLENYDIVKVVSNINELISGGTWYQVNENRYTYFLDKIPKTQRYKYHEPTILYFIKIIYSWLRFLLRKIDIDLEKFYITSHFKT